jgi:hypothetical protein
VRRALVAQRRRVSPRQRELLTGQHTARWVGGTLGCAVPTLTGWCWNSTSTRAPRRCTSNRSRPASAARGQIGPELTL